MPFTRPTLAELVARIQGDIEGRLPGADARLRRSNLGVMGTVQGGAVHGLYGYLDFLSRQIFPDTAEAEYLARWGAMYGLERKAAVAAQGSADFTGFNGTDIPAGTVLQRSDGAEFTTDALGSIAAGAAIVATTASVGGADGNTVAASKLTFVTPVAGIDSEATVAAGGLAGGIDLESDANYRVRVLLRMASGPPNGKAGDYAQWALENILVTRAWDYANHVGLGTVGVTFTLDNEAMDAAIIPDAAKVQAVQDTIDALRPRPSAVTVFAPTAAAQNFTIQLTPNTAAVQGLVEAELRDLLKRDGDPGGTLKLSRINEAISLAEGETDHVLTAPAVNVVLAAGEVPIMGVVTWT